MSDILKKYGVQAPASEQAAEQPTERTVSNSLLAKYGVKPAAEGAPEPAVPLRKGELPGTMWEKVKALPGAFWDELVTPPKNPSARAMMETMGYLGGVGTNAALEAASRVTGRGGLGSEEWKRTLRGKSTPAAETLEKNFDLSPGAALTVGLPLSIVADPMSSVMGGRTLSQVPKLSKAGVWQAMVENAKQPAGPLMPVASGLRKAGKAVFQNVWREADKALLEKRGSAASNAKGFSEWLWNNGNPRINAKMTNPQMIDEINSLEQAANKDIVAARSGAEGADLAPEVTKRRAAAGESAIAENPTLPPDAARQLGEDQYMAKLKANLRSGLAGEANARKVAGDTLKQLVPDFAPMIDENMARFTSGDTEGASKFFSQLIDDTLAGPRNIEELNDLTKRYGRTAAGSKALDSNAYQRGSTVSTGKVNAMGNRKTLAELMEQRVLEAKGQEGLDAYRKARKTYGTIATGKDAAVAKLEKAQSTPLFSALDGVIAGGTYLNPALVLPMLAGKKAIQALNNNPRAATAVGSALNSAGKSGAWDLMLRKQLNDYMRREEKQ